MAFYVDATFLCGIAMSQPLSFKNVKILENVELITLLITADDADLGYFVDFDSNIAHAFNEKNSFCSVT